MSTFKLEIEVENEAFREEPAVEIARILTALAEDLNDMYGGWVWSPGILRDINGNRVGRYELR